MLVTSSFIILCAAFVAAPIILLYAGAHIIREDDRQVEATAVEREARAS